MMKLNDNFSDEYVRLGGLNMNQDILFKYNSDMSKLEKLKCILYFFFIGLFFSLILSFSLSVLNLSISILSLSLILLFSAVFFYIFTVMNEEKVYYFLIHLLKFNFHTTSYPFSSVLNYGDCNVIRDYKPLIEWDMESVRGVAYYLRVGSLGKLKINEKSYFKYLQSYHDKNIIILKNEELKNLE